jgi:hypothetical protein
MPIRREFRVLYPSHWDEISRRVRFERAGGACERCGRPHGIELRCLPDGRWFDLRRRTWRDRRGRPARWPDLEEMTHQYTTRVILAAAHLDHDPANNRLRNLRSLCQRCHLLHDRAWHLLQRWITYRLRYAGADLFLGHTGTDAQRPSCFRRSSCGSPIRVRVGARRPAGCVRPSAYLLRSGCAVTVTQVTCSPKLNRSACSAEQTAALPTDPPAGSQDHR